MEISNSYKIPMKQNSYIGFTLFEDHGLLYLDVNGVQAQVGIPVEQALGR
jgi:hypothetical protein